MSRVAGDLYSAGKHAESEAMYNDVLRIQRKFVPENDPLVARTLFQLARVMLSAGRLPEAEERVREVLARYRPETMEYDPFVSKDQLLLFLGRVLTTRRKPAEAEAALRESAALQREMFKFNPTHQRLTNSLKELGQLLEIQQRWVEAEKVQREVIDRNRQAVAAQPANAAFQLNLGMTLTRLGEILIQQKREAEAAEVWRESITIQRAMLADSGGNRVVEPLLRLGRLLIRQEKWSEAEKIFEEAFAEDEKSARFLWSQPVALGWLEVLKRAGKTRELEAAVAKMIEACRRAPQARGARPGGAYAVEVLHALVEQGQFAAAESLVQENLAAWTQLDAEARSTYAFRSLWGCVLFGQGKFAEAEPYLLTGCEGLQRPGPRLPSGDSLVDFVRRRIDALYTQWDQPAKAAEWRKKQAQVRPGGNR